MRDRLAQISDQIKLFDEGALSPRRDTEALRIELEKVLAGPIYTKPEEEYVYSDALICYFTPEGRIIRKRPVEQESGQVYAAYVRISWISPYCTIDWQYAENGKDWMARVPPPADLKGVSETIRHSMESKSFVVLEGEILDETLPEQYSVLDDSPATVFQRLFSEI